MNNMITIRRSTTNFDELVRMTEARIRDAVNAPPSELIAVKSPMGGAEMHLQRVGFVRRYRQPL
ncbi:MAG: hypothetical protein ABIT83_12620 [Massilia sp.]